VFFELRVGAAVRLGVVIRIGEVNLVEGFCELAQQAVLELRPLGIRVQNRHL
jgi:hypothetical protein